MTLPQDPAALRRQLLKELKRLRGEAGLTQKYVADAMDWSASKVIRIESGNVTISTNDLRALLRVYGVEDDTTVAEFIQMAKESRRQSFSDYRSVIPQPVLQYYALESSAWIIRQFELSLVPGLLQTEEYTRGVLGAYGLSGDDLELRIQARTERQQLLDRETPPQMFFLLDEAVIQRQVGGARVMARQLQRIRELSDLSQVTIQIIPSSYGAYPGMAGPFALLEFPGTEGDTMLYIEGRDDYMTRDDPEQIGRYLDMFQTMEREMASKPDALTRYLDAAGSSNAVSPREGGTAST